MTERLILDCDPGHDDALAMILAAGDPRVELLAVTTCAGNQTLAKVTRNALAVCAVAGIDVPVAAGGGGAPGPPPEGAPGGPRGARPGGPRGPPGPPRPGPPPPGP